MLITEVTKIYTADKLEKSKVIQADEKEITPENTYSVYMLLNELDSETNEKLAGNKIKITSNSNQTITVYDALSEEEITNDKDGNIEIPQNGIKLKINGIQKDSISEIQVEEVGEVQDYINNFKKLTIAIDTRDGQVLAYVKNITKIVDGKEVTTDGSEEKTANFMYQDTDGKIKIKENSEVQIYYVIADINGLTQEQLNNSEWNIYNKEEGIKLEKNGVIYSKSRYKNGEYSQINTLHINNIDKLAPSIEVTEKVLNQEKDEVILTIGIQDAEETNEYGKSGIYGYAITTQEEEPKDFIVSDKLTEKVNGITEDGIYFAWVKDKAGNVAHIQFEVTNFEEEANKTVAIILDAPEETLKGTQYNSLTNLLEKLDELGITEQSGQVLVQIVNDISNSSTDITNKNLLIDLNGYTINSKKDKEAINLLSGNVTIVDKKLNISDYITDTELLATLTFTSKTDGNGTIYSKNNEAIKIESGATLTLGENGEEVPSVVVPAITGLTYGVKNSGTFNFYDGIITGATEAIGGAVKEIPEEYEIILSYVNDNEIATLGKQEAIAYVGDDENNLFGDLQDAIDDCGAENKITLIKNSTITKLEKQIIAEQNVTLNLNGYEIKSYIPENTIINRGTLKITDLTQKAEGRIYGLGDKVINNEGDSTELTILKGEIRGNNFVINNEGNGIITLGENDGNTPSTTVPSIIGENVAVKHGLGTFNFYDGVIRGKTTLEGTRVADFPEDYKVSTYAHGESEEFEIEEGKQITVLEQIKVAHVKSTNLIYSSLEKAIEVASSDEQDTITLLVNLTDAEMLKQTVEFPEGKDIILDLLGHSIHSGPTPIVNMGTLKIVDTVGNGNITTQAESGIINQGAGTLEVELKEGIIRGNGYGIKNNSTGDVTINSGTVIGTGHGIYNFTTGAVKVKGGTITGTNAHGIYNENIGTIETSGGQINGANSGIYNDKEGTLVVTDGEITGNGAYGIYNGSTGSLTVSGGTINCENQAGIFNKSTGEIVISNGEINGGNYAIQCDNGGKITVDGGQIRANTAIITNGQIEVNGGTIEGTKEVTEVFDSNGTGIIQNGAGKVIVTDGIILGKSNGILLYANAEAQINGGQITGDINGIKTNGYNTKITVDGGQITGNGQNNGAGITSESMGTITVNEGTITGYHYGIFASNATVTIDGGTISANGNNIYKVTDIDIRLDSTAGVWSGGTLNITGGQITGTANEGIGIGVLSEGNATITDAIVRGNSYGIHYRGSYNKITINADVSGEIYGLHMFAGTATIDGGTIKSSGTNGSGIYTHSGNIVINNGEVSGDYCGIDTSKTTGRQITVNGGIIQGKGEKGCGINSQSGSSPITINEGTILGTIYGIHQDVGGYAKIIQNGGTISAQGLADVESYGIYDESVSEIEIKGGAVSGEKYGIYKSLYGQIILGEKNLQELNTENPSITGKIYGIYAPDNRKTLKLYAGRITGGTEAINSSIDEIKDGYNIVVTNVDNNEIITLGEVEEQNIAYVGEDEQTQYSTLQEAVEACGTEEKTITLIKDDITIRETQISEGQNIKINLNGHKIKMYAKQAIVNNGTLTIEDKTQQADGALYGCADKIINNLEDSTLIINSGIISSSSNYGVYNTSTGNININGGTVEGKVSGIYNFAEGTITVNNGIINSDSYGISNNGEGIINLNGGNVTGKIYGIYNNLGRFNYQDGRVAGGIEAINSSIDEIKDGHGLVLTNEANNEIATIVAQEEQKIAYVGEDEQTQYSTLQEAIQACGTEEKTITLIKDSIQITGAEIVEGQNITIDLNGHNIRIYAKEAIINKGTLTIQDKAQETVGKLYGCANKIINNGAGAVLTIDGGIISSSSNYGIYSEDTGTININRGTITGKNTGIYNLGEATVTINNGIINGDIYGICNNGIGTIAVSNGKISGKDTGIYNNSGTVNILGGTIIGEEYGVYSYNNGTITLGENDGSLPSLENPNITGENYGICVNSGNFNFYDGIITGHTSGAIAKYVLPNIPENYQLKYEENETIATLENIETAIISRNEKIMAYTSSLNTKEKRAIVLSTQPTITYSPTEWTNTDVNAILNTDIIPILNLYNEKKLVSENKLTTTIIRKNENSTLEENQVDVGDKIAVKITVENPTQEEYSIIYTIPEGVEVIEIPDGARKEADTIIWEITKPQDGQNVEVEVILEVEYARESHLIENMATVNNEQTNKISQEYIKSEITLESTLEKTGSKKITSVAENVDYNITFNATVNKFIGQAVITIVDTLPCPINEEKSELLGGKYDKNANTITWTEKINDINTYMTEIEKTISITKDISINYDFTNIDQLEQISNQIKCTIELQEPNKEDITQYDTVKTQEKTGTSAETSIEIPEAVVIVHHYIYDEKEETQENKYTNIKLVEDEELKGLVGTSYETVKSSNIPKNYICINEEPKDYKGEMKENTIEVNYYYKLAIPEIQNDIAITASVDTEKIDKNGVETYSDESVVITNENSPITYNITYNATVKNYIGKAKIEIVDTLPEGINLEKSDLAHGEYNEETNTIKWIEEIENINTYTETSTVEGTHNIQITKKIIIVYENQNKIKDLVNQVDGEITTYYIQEPLNKQEELLKLNATQKVRVKQEYKTNFKVVKVWDDNENEKKKRPESVTLEIRILPNDRIIKVVLNEENNWTYEEKGLPKYSNTTGKKVTYEITEKETNAGDLKYYEQAKITQNEEQEDNETNYIATVTNTFVNTKGKVIVKYIDLDTDDEIAIIDNEFQTYGYEIEGLLGDEYSTEQKEIPYYVFVKDSGNTKGTLSKEGEVIYYYRKLKFDFSVEKTFENIKLNGKELKISDKQLVKIELKPDEINDTELIIKYKIKVTNNGELDGKVKLQDIIPNSYEIIETPDYWEIIGQDKLETEIELLTGESRELNVTLKWINKESNLGTQANTIKIIDSQNIADYIDINEKDNVSSATVILNIKTGIVESWIIIILIITTFVICAYVTISIAGRKNPEIKNIKFFKK